MKTIKPILFAILICVAITSCHTTTTTNAGNWVSKSAYNGVVRSEAVSFVINDTGYIGTGYDGNNRLADIGGIMPLRIFGTKRLTLAVRPGIQP